MTSTMTWRQALRDELFKGNILKLPRKYRDLIAVHGASRAKAVAYLASIGGYYDHGQHFAFSWYAKVDRADFSVEHLYAHEARQDFSSLQNLCTNDGERGVLFNLFKIEHAKYGDSLWNRATEEVWETFEQDDSTFWGGERDSKFSLRGRSGGHLVLSQCGRLNTTQRIEDLERDLLEKDESDHGRYVIGNLDVAHLFLVCVQISADWPTAEISEAVERAASWSVWANVERDTLVQALHDYEHAKDLIDRTRLGIVEGEDFFKTVALLLGVNEEP